MFLLKNVFTENYLCEMSSKVSFESFAVRWCVWDQRSPSMDQKAPSIAI